MAAKRLSLTDYAEQHPLRRPGNKAWIESLPEFEDIIAAYRSGVAGTVIRRWLHDSPEDGGCGYGKLATEAKVEDWLRAHAADVE